MNDKPISARPLAFAVVIVLVLRLLALGAPVGLAEESFFQNQTIPTFTPTPLPVTPSVTPSVSVIPPTSVTDLPPVSRTPTPEPASSATPAPATETPSPIPTQPGLTATPSPTGPEATATPATVTPGATLTPPGNTPPSAEATVDLPTPGVGEPSVTPLPASEAPGPAASPTAMQVQPTLPPWTPALGGTSTASGSSCIWPVTGLLLVVLGALLLAWRGRRTWKAVKGTMIQSVRSLDRLKAASSLCDFAGQACGLHNLGLAAGEHVVADGPSSARSSGESAFQRLPQQRLANLGRSPTASATALSSSRGSGLNGST